MSTKVVFRKWKDNGAILALFPQIPGDYQGDLCQSYMTVGQHSGANYYHCIDKRTTKATPCEYQDLLNELIAIGYADLVIRTKAQQEDHNIRKKEARRLRQHITPLNAPFAP